MSTLWQLSCLRKEAIHCNYAEQNAKLKHTGLPNNTSRSLYTKVRKKICAKIAQILRKKVSHFVETLIPHQLLYRGFP